MGAPRQRPVCAACLSPSGGRQASVAAGRARKYSKFRPKPTLLERSDKSLNSKDTFTEEGRE